MPILTWKIQKSTKQKITIISLYFKTPFKLSIHRISLNPKPLKKRIIPASSESLFSRFPPLKGVEKDL